MNEFDCDVAIVGAGPAGATLANLLGEAGVSAVVLEASGSIVAYPRAVGIDDEAIRTLQSFGLAQVVLDNSLQNMPIRYHDAAGTVLAHVAPSAQPYGWPRRNLFYQPYLEERLREHLAGYPTVELRTDTEVTGLSQDEDGVRLGIRTGTTESTVRARYAVGADGGRSFVRGVLGTEMLGDTAPVKWLVIDVEKDTWDAPYSAVYTSSVRPSMTIPLPFGYRRFEFQIRAEEDPAAASDPDRVQRLLKRFYPDSPVPPVVRADVYWHHSRTAAEFSVGRVFLVGDAAHMQPPFFGQGMNSGFRDVTNLAWKLAAVVDGRASERILASYDSERRSNASEMVKFATRMGQMYKAKSPLTERVRSTLFRGAQKVPGARDYILQMKHKPVPRYTEGLVVGAAASQGGSLVGRAFPQPMVHSADHDGARRLDDVLGSRIAVVGLVPDVARALSTHTVGRLRAQGGVLVQVRPATVYQRDSTEAADLASEALDVFDVDGNLRDLVLSRPADEVYMVRPDRYVAAACRAADLERVLGAFLALLEQ
ncbi:bifunctional 3-(3-hydroxy-phenyl)propionate/3-hydroxycinnamic acid hydroxylase [Streptomyces sp. NPDC096311]|uniref:bifunctional 3-(3-hydroxy-phenyl)propionate/3-hydroxycinnamic acid hydroxylase n=1 Tax=Streptomyces sp. NPDC096311 TaxID=3366083 RepID=UPI003825A445